MTTSSTLQRPPVKEEPLPAKKLEPPAARLTWPQAVAWRLRRHHLDRRVARSEMVAVAERLCGLHAQLMSSAELTLWARVEDLEPQALADGLWKERTLVKTWAMRGTLHVLPAADYPMWQSALSTYRNYLKPSWLRAFGVSADKLERFLGAVADALRDQLLTREELAAAVSRLTGSAELGEKVLGSWGSLLKPACYRGQLCFGPGVGQKVRFAHPETWLGPSDAVDPQAAVLDVARAFLGAHGPATRDDFARWWAISPAQGQATIKGLGEEAVEVDVEGTPAWMLAESLPGARERRRPHSVRLLPAFDQWVIAATRHVDQLLPGPLSSRIYRPQGWISPVLAVDGHTLGVWRHERKGAAVEVEIEPFVDLPAKVRRAAEHEAERLAAFLGGTLKLSWAATP
ncbi:MAG: winged helix DNA-binding domain-containing protein [Acidimicrobiales bacterium]